MGLPASGGRTIPCLFKFEADCLVVCYGLSGVRPSAFGTKAGAQLYLVTYARRSG
jgi:hypothetical protein